MVKLMENSNFRKKLIFSSKVKDFEPTKITDPSLWKYCDEYSVMLALMYCFPDQYSDLMHSDKPDLQIPNLVGIEVTQCLDEDYNASIGELIAYNMGKNGKSLKKVKDKISEHGGELNDFCLIHKTATEETQMVPIRKGIDKKLSKLSEYRHQFKECCLAIILEEPIRTVPKLALDYFLKKQKESRYKFDKFIILTNRTLIIYNCATNFVSRKDITKEDKRNIDYAAVMLGNGFLDNVKDCFE